MYVVIKNDTIHGPCTITEATEFSIKINGKVKNLLPNLIEYSFDYIKKNPGYYESCQHGFLVFSDGKTVVKIEEGARIIHMENGNYSDTSFVKTIP